MSTDNAQRRLLEALAELGRAQNLDIGTSSDPLVAFAHGIQYAMDVAIGAGESEVASVYACLGSLAMSVRDDLTTKENTND